MILGHKCALITVAPTLRRCRKWAMFWLLLLHRIAVIAVAPTVEGIWMLWWPPCILY